MARASSIFAIGRAVDFDHVQCRSSANLYARGTSPARIGRRPLFAIEASRHDARGSRLADSANACEKESMRDTAALERLRQGARNVLLPDQFAEPFGAPFTRKHEVG